MGQLIEQLNREAVRYSCERYGRPGCSARRLSARLPVKQSSRSSIAASSLAAAPLPSSLVGCLVRPLLAPPRPAVDNHPCCPQEWRLRAGQVRGPIPDPVIQVSTRRKLPQNFGTKSPTSESCQPVTSNLSPRILSCYWQEKDVAIQRAIALRV